MTVLKLPQEPLRAAAKETSVSFLGFLDEGELA
jgi:hypothetical protein